MSEPMGLREWIIPQDRAFFEWFLAASDNVTRCADALAELFRNYSGLADKRQHIKDLEHHGDQITHRVFDALSRTFILPLDREDISALAKALDDIADFIYAAANRLYLYEVTKPTAPMAKFAEILQLQSKEIGTALRAIQNSKTSSQALQHGIEVNRLENEADRLLNETVASLFRGSDPIQIMKLKEIYEILETATDKCEDAADVISDIVRKQG